MPPGLDWTATKRDLPAPNSFQINTVIAACVMILVAGIFWNVRYLRDMISAIKCLVVATHECFHILTGLACGGTIVSVCIDPNEGGATHIMDLMRVEPRETFDGEYPKTQGQLYWSTRALLTLAMGYFGSALVGFAYVFCAFDIVASKIASFTIAFAMLVPLVRADTICCFALEVILVGLWFGDHGSALRFFVLWIGVMNLFYSVWDYLDEALFDKPHTSDCVQFGEMFGMEPAVFFVIWLVWDILVFAAAVCAGIGVFHKSPQKMYADAATFLPT